MSFDHLPSQGRPPFQWIWCGTSRANLRIDFGENRSSPVDTQICLPFAAYSMVQAVPS
ncbi:hypothetical protein ACFO1V_00375 [Daeguia caeni]|uniref:Uncharacterized protein n=1 Tax=Daeguia caeni TaxID=439612 RepID=A0ABV9GZR9_9HYPH